MIIGIPKENIPGESRVALVPANVESLIKKGLQVLVENGAGDSAGYPDQLFRDAGAELTDSREQLFERADMVLKVRGGEEADFGLLRKGQVVAAMMDPLGTPKIAKTVADTGATGLALELVPRITRAQSMDVLSSMATVAGYKAVLMAANLSGRMFPMLMTAAGTIKPAKVFVMGAGVAGLQALATAKRLGAVVSAYDVRPAAREQILSVGAKPVELELETEQSEDKGGYAKAQGEEFLRRQRELMTEVVAQQDVVITTAAVPGAKSPILVTADMVKAMKPGSVILDLAAERGGNCELTQLDEVVESNGVKIYGPGNIPSTVAFHASQMFGKNMENLISLLIGEEGQLKLDFEDEIITSTVIAHDGDVPHAKMRELLEMPPLAEPKTQEES